MISCLRRGGLRLRLSLRLSPGLRVGAGGTAVVEGWAVAWFLLLARKLLLVLGHRGGRILPLGSLGVCRIRLVIRLIWFVMI